MVQILHNPRFDRCFCGHRRGKHGSDSPWDRCGTTACLLDSCNCQCFEPAIVTAKGTVIERYRKTGVGKLVGHHLYLHEDYALEAIAKIKANNPDVGLRLELALAERIKEFPSFKFRCLRLDLKDGLVRFDEAPDFDEAREPKVGQWLLVCHDGYARKGHSDSIWHHRHLWVKDSYPGFYVAEAKRWSATYAPLLLTPPSGSARIFARQLAEVGLA